MTSEQKKLLDHIYAVSFAAYDTQLFLDTHPDCQEARAYACQMMEERQKALCEYQDRYEPLTVEGACMNNCTNWAWATTPWPWERGNC